MPLRFNQLLAEVGISPADVRLLRHQTNLGRGLSLLETWRADPALFEAYQALQHASKRVSFQRPFWAAFFGTWDSRTLFGGLYEVSDPEPVLEPASVPLTGAQAEPGTLERYQLRVSPLLEEYRERLYIEWGGGPSGRRSWNQRAEAQDKVITELYLDAVERPFPGYMEISAPLSSIGEAPAGWIRRLSEARGIYLLACPRTGELYVGSATAAGGFWERWQEYRRTGHGGNVGLVDREPSDWRVSILQVAGSAETNDDILAAEQRWKDKLLSRELGLNRN